MTLYGYARVSTDGQDTTLQVVALRRAGVQHVVQERRSGVKHRPRLDALLGQLQAGDVLVVYKLDRVARSLRDLLATLDRLSEVGAGFRSLTEPIDTSTPAGRLMLQLLGAVAQFEWSLIRERSMAGQAAARARGVQFGRPRKLDYGAISALLDAGLSCDQVAARLGLARQSVHWAARTIRGERGPGRRR